MFVRNNDASILVNNSTRRDQFIREVTGIDLHHNMNRKGGPSLKGGEIPVTGCGGQ
jgi:hypothetical protein